MIIKFYLIRLEISCIKLITGFLVKNNIIFTYQKHLVNISLRKYKINVEAYI